MKKPVKTPPQTDTASSVEAGSSIPSMEIAKMADSASSAGGDAVPDLTPPESESASGEGFAAGVWNNDKRINALFCANEVRNAWVGVVGVGWVKLASSIDSANEALNILAGCAKTKNSPVNYNVDGGQITEMYVW